MIKSFILRHSDVDIGFGYPCQTTFYVKDNEVQVVTIMNDMGSDGYWYETYNAKLSLEDARAKWRALYKCR